MRPEHATPEPTADPGTPGTGEELLLTSPDAVPTKWKLQSTQTVGMAMAFTGKRLVIVGKGGTSFVSP